MSDSRLWELLARKYNGEISDEEMLELEQLLKEQHHGIQLNELLTDLHEFPVKNMTTAFDETRSRVSIMHSLDNIRRLTDHLHNENDEDDFSSESTNRRFRTISKGIVLTLAGGLLIFLYFLQNSSNEGVVKKDTPQVNEVVTNGGSKSTVHLPDGSFVILNTGSRLVYNKDFGLESRDVYLTGEGFFDIARNEKIPLIVHAGNVDIKVKGTSFNVKAYSEDSLVEAALIHGSIEVFTHADPERKILLRPNEKIIIGKASVITSPRKGDKQIATKGEVFSLGKIVPNPLDSTISEIAWIKNKLAFYKEPFETLAKKMERWYNVSIEFNDAQLGQLTFTGSFEREDIVEALDALRQIAPFQYIIHNRTVTIGKSK